MNIEEFSSHAHTGSPHPLDLVFCFLHPAHFLLVFPISMTFTDYFRPMIFSGMLAVPVCSLSSSFLILVPLSYQPEDAARDPDFSLDDGVRRSTLGSYDGCHGCPIDKGRNDEIMAVVFVGVGGHCSPALS